MPTAAELQERYDRRYYVRELSRGDAYVHREESWQVTSRRTLALARSLQLLMMFLNQEQRHTLLTYGWFAEKAASSGRIYRFRWGYEAGNVRVLDDRGLITEHICLVGRSPREYVTGDHIASQLFLLRADENEFRRIARIETIYTPYFGQYDY